MLFKKIEVSLLDVGVLYTTMAFIMGTVGAMSYVIGKEKGREEAKRKSRTIHYHDVYNTRD